MDVSPWGIPFPPSVSKFQQAFEEPFGEPPLTACMSLCTIRNEERDRASRTIASIQDYYGHQRIPRSCGAWYPYLAYARKKPKPLTWRLWLYSTLRLVLWRELFFAGIIGTAWFLLLAYREQARTIIPNAESMFSVLIFAIGIFLNGFVERVLDLFSAARKGFDSTMAVSRDFASSVATLARIKVMKGTTVTADGVAMLVRLQFLMHCIPYAILQEVRGAIHYERLPLLKSLVDELRAENNISEDRLQTLFSMLRLALGVAEGAILHNDVVAKALYLYINDITAMLATLRAEVGYDIPSRYVNTLKESIALFVGLLPIILFDPTDWWWAYVFLVVVIYVVYGFFLQSQEIHNPLGDQAVYNEADAPIEEWAHIAAFDVDNEYANALRYMLTRGTIPQDPQTGLYRAGEYLLNQYGIVVAVSPAPSISKVYETSSFNV